MNIADDVVVFREETDACFRSAFNPYPGRLGNFLGLAEQGKRIKISRKARQQPTGGR